MHVVRQAGQSRRNFIFRYLNQNCRLAVDKHRVIDLSGQIPVNKLCRLRHGIIMTGFDDLDLIGGRIEPQLTHGNVYLLSRSLRPLIRLCLYRRAHRDLKVICVILGQHQFDVFSMLAVLDIVVPVLNYLDGGRRQDHLCLRQRRRAVGVSCAFKLIRCIQMRIGQQIIHACCFIITNTCCCQLLIRHCDLFIVQISNFIISFLARPYGEF